MAEFATHLKFIARMAFFVFNIVFLVPCQHAFAECESSIKLDGTVSVECCAPREKCIPAGKAVYEYTEAAKDDPSLLSISMNASPWHLYDGDMRILTIEELAAMVKPNIGNGVKRVVLVASWTAVPPDVNSNSIAQKLSHLLNDFPVSGMDGFVWIAKDGTVRTTRQAFTIKQTCPYGIHPGDEVMVSLVAGWPIEFEENYIKKGDSDGIMRAGAGWDIYMLCPDKALQLFEAAAKLSNPIAAYNAALIHLERGKKTDLDAAIALLSQAAALGDKKAQDRVQQLKRKNQ